MARNIGFILITAMILAACASFEIPREEARTAWELEPALPAGFGTPIAATLHVARPIPVAALATTDIAYRQQDFERSYYARNRWVDEPSRLVHAHLVSALEAAGVFDTVMSSTTSAPARYRLETELLELVHDYRERPQGVAHIELRGRLVDLHDGAVLSTRRFTAQADSLEATAGAGVAATSQAMEELLEAIVAWVGESVTPTPTSGAP